MEKLRVAFSTNDDDRTVLVTDSRPYESGSEGYFLGGKITLADGKLYQLSCNVIRVDSQLEPEAAERAEFVKALKAEKARIKAEKQAARDRK